MMSHSKTQRKPAHSISVSLSKEAFRSLRKLIIVPSDSDRSLEFLRLNHPTSSTKPSNIENVSNNENQAMNSKVDREIASNITIKDSSSQAKEELPHGTFATEEPLSPEEAEYKSDEEPKQNPKTESKDQRTSEEIYRQDLAPTQSPRKHKDTQKKLKNDMAVEESNNQKSSSGIPHRGNYKKKSDNIKNQNPYNFKATKMPVYKPFEVKKSEKTCSVAKEPNFALSKRLGPKVPETKPVVVNKDKNKNRSASCEEMPDKSVSVNKNNKKGYQPRPLTVPKSPSFALEKRLGTRAPTVEPIKKRGLYIDSDGVMREPVFGGVEIDWETINERVKQGVVLHKKE